MKDWIKRLLRLDAEEAIDLNEGEAILHVTGRHWIVFLVRLIVPVAGLLFFGGLAAYRALGGGFLVENTNEPAGLDFFNWLLIVVEAVLALLWLALWVRRSKDWRARNVLLVANAVILLLIYFRYQGGRIFYVDPFLFVNQATDLLNVLLITIAAICLLFVFFTFYDWLNDELILTNQRVVYDNDQVFIPRLLERRVQEQIFIRDVQDVDWNTKTYTQHWLKYGTVTVKSARFKGELRFDSAINPKDMADKIMGEVKAQRKQRSEKDLERLVETKVYNTPLEKTPFRRDIKTTQLVKALNWLIPENPEINEDNGQYTWRAHWLFLLRSLVGPLLLLFFGLLGVVLLNRLIVIAPAWTAVGSFAVFLIFAAWAAWEVEDYRNDTYILTTTNVVDTEKKPFGPEDQRRASLGALNNISYQTTFISNLLGYGNVVLETAGSGGAFTFNHVPRPGDVVSKINQYYDSFKAGDRERNLNDSLDLLRHYHQAQQRHNELNIPPA